jgi:hypothetical protein
MPPCLNGRVIGLNQNLKADETNRFIVSPILATSFTRPSLTVKSKTMKTKTRSILAVGVCLLSLAALSACAQLKSSLSSWAVKPGKVEVLRPAQTNLVQTVTTNTADSVAITNVDGTIIPPHTVFTIVTNITPIIQPAVVFTNLALAPLVQNGIATVDTTASAAGIPWAHTAATAVLAGLGLFLSWTNSRNKRKLQASIADHAETSDALDTAQDVAQTLVQNFEQLRQVALTVPGYTRDIDDKVMTAVQVAQQIAGVKGEINDLVDDHTNTTIPGGGTIAAN